MKDTLSKLLIFAAGAGIGSAVTWKFLKTKFEQIAKEEINEVKEYYRKKSGETESADESESATVFDVGQAMVAGFRNGLEGDTETVSKLDVASYSSIIQDEGYSESGEEVADTDEPYIIDADEFGESYEYDTNSLIYYSDGILATEMDEIIDDIDSIVGTKNLTKFDDTNVIFVRNDRTKCDYEVVRERRTFEEVNGVDDPPDEV